MSHNLFLIAHKVRGECAYDIALPMECPECHYIGCAECDDTGRWWIIPTSGHRAYPFWHKSIEADAPEMPDNLPDHCRLLAAPRTSNIEAILALMPKPQGPQMKRRF